MNWRKYICTITGHTYGKWIPLIAGDKQIHLMSKEEGQIQLKPVRYWECECSKCGMELNFAEAMKTYEDKIPVDFMRNIQKQWRYKV